MKDRNKVDKRSLQKKTMGQWKKNKYTPKLGKKEWWKSLSVAGRYREERKTLTLKGGNIEVV